MKQIRKQSINLINAVNKLRKALIKQRDSELFGKGNFELLAKLFKNHAGNLKPMDLIKYFQHTDKIQFDDEPFTKLEKIEWDNLVNDTTEAYKELELKNI